MIKAILFLILLSNVAWAAPSISSTSGGFTHNGTVTISGTGFGTKSPAAPTSYDDFELGSNGNTLGSAKVGAGWNFLTTGTSTVNPKYSNTQNPTNSTLTAMCQWKGGGQQTQCGFGWSGAINSDRMYIYYKRYMVPSSWPISSSNVKQFYIYGNSGSDFPQGMALIPGGNSSWAYYDNSGNASHTLYYPNGPSFGGTNNTWQTWEFYDQLNTVGSANGTVTVTVDGSSKLSVSNYQQRTTSNNFDDFKLGHMYQMIGASTSSHTAQCYYDNVYLDVTQARIMIGNASTFSNSTQREIQIPTAWSSTSATITVNRGAFSNGTQAYLYVIDSTGAVSPGYGITFGGTAPSDTTPPTLQSISPANGTVNIPTTTDIVGTFTDTTGVGTVTMTIYDGTSLVNESSNLTQSGGTFTLMHGNRASSFDSGESISMSLTVSDTAASPNQTNQVINYTVVENQAPAQTVFSGGLIGDRDNWTEKLWNGSDIFGVFTDGISPTNYEYGTQGSFVRGSLFQPGAIAMYEVTQSGNSVIDFRYKGLGDVVNTAVDMTVGFAANSITLGTKTSYFIRLNSLQGSTFAGYYDTTGERQTVDFVIEKSIPDNLWHDGKFEIGSNGGTWKFYKDGNLYYTGPITSDPSGYFWFGSDNDSVRIDGIIINGQEVPISPSVLKPYKYIPLTRTRSSDRITFGGSKSGRIKLGRST